LNGKTAKAPRAPKPSPHAIGGRTAITAIFGDPVEHSLSPAMHNAAYAALGLDRVYVAFRVTPRSLADAIRAIAALGILGVNLTVPHKEAAVPIMRALSDEAKLLGAVNCVVNRGGELFGDSSDARGLERDLRSRRVNLREKTAIVIGAGGAAAAALVACERIGASEVIVANRTRERAEALADRFRRTDGPAIAVRGLDALNDGALLSEVAAIINATSMGLTTAEFAKLDYASTPTGCFFYDTIYSAKPTPFLAPAIALGRKHADGAGMLAGQGELAFELFNRVAPPRGVMMRALMERLGRA
jgi:shikimate dehydrogenase